jgi:hypothetical protein
MVYRLIPTHRFAPRSRFGEELTNPALLKGVGIAVLIALVLLAVVYFIALQKNNTSLSSYVELDNDGNKKLKWKCVILHLALPIIISSALAGAVIGHIGVDKLTDQKLVLYELGGLVVAVVILVVVGYLALKKDNTSLSRYVNVKSDGTKELKMANFSLELVLPVCLTCVSLASLVSEQMN